MKRLVCIILCLAFCFSVCGCAPGGYLNSTDGDITVSLPEPTEPNLPQFTEEQKLILGKWNLISITTGDNTVSYTDSSYVFTETGRCIVTINDAKTDGGFKFDESLLVIDGSPVTYVIENDTMTITTAAGTVHNLVKAAETPAQ